MTRAIGTAADLRESELCAARSVKAEGRLRSEIANVRGEIASVRTEILKWVIIGAIGLLH